MHQKNGNGTFTSKIGFVLAAVGSAVGMGNIWMFPYRTGQYGGAAFLIPYLLFIALFGYVGLSGEFAFGRMTGTGPIGSYEFAMKSRGKKGGAILGTIPLLGSLGIAIGYAIIVGWVLRSAFGALTGSLMSTEPEQFFTEMSSTNFSSVPWHTLVILLTAAVLIFGVSGGIEKINKVMMPAFFILFIIIAVRVAFLPNAIEGYKYLLVPQWEYLFNPRTWIMAMGQAFFTLSLGIGALAIFGSYIGKERKLTGEAISITILDTFVAIVAGLIIFPACFAFGVDPGEGPGLVFVTLPNVFNAMAGGRIWGTFFFLFMTFAALSTIIAVFQNIIAFAQDLWGWNLKKASFVNMIAVFVLSLPCIFGMTIWSDFTILGKDIMGFEDFLVSNNLLPLGSLVYLMFCVSRYGWGWDNFLKEANTGAGISFPKKIRFYLNYILPLIVLYIFFQGYWSLFQSL